MTDEDESDEDEADLWARARRGDEAALRKLLLRLVPEVRAFIQHSMPPAIDAKESVSDLTQSLVGDLLPELPRGQFDGPDALRAWFRACALNKIRARLRHWRAERREEGRDVAMHDVGSDPFAGREPSPSAAAHEDEARERLRAALEQLPEDQRELVVMVKLAGLSYSEAAATMERSVSGCRKIVSRAMVRLSGLLPDE